MPAIILPLLRYVVIAALQTGAIVAVQSALENIIDLIRDNIKKAANLTDTETSNIVSDGVIEVLTILGVTVASLKSKIPIRIADKLGLTASRVAGKISSAATIEKVAKVEAKIAQGISLKKTFLVSLVGSLGALIPWLPSVLSNILDHPVFQVKQINRILSSFGIPFQWPEADPLDSPGSFSQSEFEDYVRGLEAQGIVAVNNPCKAASVLYSHKALAELVDCIYGRENVKGVSTTVTKLKPAIAPYLVIPGSPVATAVSAPAPVAKATTVPQVKVFTGVLSQGTLGSGLSFTARPDDLIENVAELQAAAQNNLAATLAALPASLSYEIKITSSVTTKDGFTQKGQVQKVVSGYNKDGSPKYRTVVNKFAVLSVYLVNDKGTRTRIRQITLGPTDAVRFQPSSVDLSGVETAVKGNIHTTDVTDIQKVVTPAPLAVASVPDAKPVVVQPDPLATVYAPVTDYKDSGYRFYSFPVNGHTEYEVLPWVGNIPFEHTPITRDQIIAGLRAKTLDGYYGDIKPFQQLANDIENGKYDGGSGYTFVNGVPYTVASAQEADRNKQLAAQGYLKEIKVGNGIGYIPTGKTPAAAAPKPAVCAATTLYELSVAQGVALPSVAQRAPDYERLGLGQASMYTGTAEQNTRLLRALQKEAGCGA